MNGVRETDKRQREDDTFDFEKLVVYQLALNWLDQIIVHCRNLPGDLRYSLGDQLIRAALSVSNNLAEGAGKRSKKERSRYYSTSLDSARECISMFTVLKRQSVIDEKQFVALRHQGRRITGMLFGLMGAL